MLERSTRRIRPIDTDIAGLEDRHATSLGVDAPAGDDQRSSSPGPRRWSDPDESFVLWGLLFFFGLGIYAAAMVALGMWLTS